MRLEDNGAHALGEYPGADKVKYNESIFVGYRWHDKEQLKPLFAFGHGLSYTAFAVGNVKADRTTLAPNGSIRISADVTNTGDRAGAEVVQLYIGDEQSSLPRPVKELKGFQKVSLNPGQTQTVTFEITPGCCSTTTTQRVRGWPSRARSRPMWAPRRTIFAARWNSS